MAGGLLAAGGRTDVDVPDELFDEASGRWFELMAEPRGSTQVVSLPAAALAANAARGHTAAGLEIHHSGVPVGAVADGPVEQA